MITEEKIKEIKKLLRGGVPEGEIKEDLKKEGYSTGDIDKVFAPHKYDMSPWYLFFAIILLLVGFWHFFKPGGLPAFIFSGLLFFQYYRETERLRE